MKEYTKIQTIFKRDMSNKGRIILDQYSLPEFEYLKGLYYKQKYEELTRLV